MTISKKQKKVLFQRLFKGLELDKGDVIMFRRGKVPWRVEWKTKEGVSIVALGTKYSARYLYPRDHKRVRKITGVPLVRWLLRNRPTLLPKIITSGKRRIKLIRKVVKAGDIEDINFSGLK